MILRTQDQAKPSTLHLPTEACLTSVDAFPALFKFSYQVQRHQSIRRHRCQALATWRYLHRPCCVALTPGIPRRSDIPRHHDGARCLAAAASGQLGEVEAKSKGERPMASSASGESMQKVRLLRAQSCRIMPHDKSPNNNNAAHIILKYA